MINQNYYCMLDFETDSVNPLTTNPIQIGSIIINPFKLEIIEGSEFSSWVKPDCEINQEYYQKNKDTLDFHCRNQNISIDQLLEKIKSSPPEKVVWDQYKEYLKKYHTRANNQNMFSAPILCAYNLHKFDEKILQRLCEKYKCINKEGTQNLFHPRDKIDILELVFMWFQFMNEPPNYTMDTLRDFFGLSQEGSHDAASDVLQEAAILCKFLKLHHNLAHKIQFKGSFLNEKNKIM